MRRLRVNAWANGAALATLTTCAGLLLGASTAHAALYRCPSPFAEGLVVTNIVNELAATERGCEPLQQRRSALDGPLPPTPPAPGSANAAGRHAEDWMAPARTGPRTDQQVGPRRGNRQAAKPLAEPVPTAADTGALRAEVKRVDTSTQRARDSDRKRILQSELEAELAAQQSLLSRAASSEPAQRQEQQARSQRHAANIDALRRELSRVP
jgi:hypothetical protein